MRLDKERLEDIFEAIENIERHLPATSDEFHGNELVRVWCLRRLEIIGEAAANLSQDVRDQSPNVPWKQIIGMRNTLIHAYFDINLDIVWDTVTSNLPPLIAELEKLLAEDDD